MQARGLLNYRLKYCCPEVIYCIWQPNELEREIKKTGGAKQNSGGAWPTQAPLRIATEYYWELRSQNAQNIEGLMCPLSTIKECPPFQKEAWIGLRELTRKA